MLGFMFKHYDPFVTRYIVYDDGSSDGSLEILRRHPKVDLRRLPPYSDPSSRTLSAVKYFNQVWLESRGSADWVIVTDIDEHIYHPDLADYLQVCQAMGVSLIPALGYQMLSERFPEPDDLLLCNNLTKGAPWERMSKLGLFAPDLIEATNYETGRHSCAPTGQIVLPPRDELLLLHYKYLDLQRTQARHEQCATRSRATDIANGWGHRYLWSKEQLEADWRQFEANLIDVADPSIDHHGSHSEPRWWAPYPRAHSR
jgi:hypothetical protein